MDFLDTERAAGQAVSNHFLQEHACKLAVQMNLGNFEASNHNLARWKACFNVSMRVGTNESQRLPADYAEVISVFRRAVGSLHLEHSYSNFSIANMDQTIVHMDCPAKRTNNVAGESSIRIVNTGCDRRGLMVPLYATAAGIKLPALVVPKEPTRRIPPRALFALQILGIVSISAHGLCYFWFDGPNKLQHKKKL
ncbi:hypothetical protein HPB47_021323 [Ixodes persulcatus]|uniref:Uncharacterized protein n=1 Tax=Ixodes persulcatus TaxID=34615 RepID=A0AC60QDV5_IXOPE|nr:hypothetical protein HPB47_021323 [Ixodes persulcatus]